jgi:hypothetical protein
VTTFIGVLVSVTGLLLVSSIPVFVVARRHARPRVARRFLIAAGVIGLFFAASALASEQLVENCGAAGGVACLDAGFSGMLFFVAGGYITVALVAAFVLARQ